MVFYIIHKLSNILEPLSICINTNKIFCKFVPFFPQSKSNAQISQILHHNVKHYHVSQPLCTCSTDSVTDHDNPVVKSIVIHTIPKYHLLIHKKNSKVIQENNVMRHFLSPKYWIGTQNVIMKNYSCQKPCKGFMEMGYKNFSCFFMISLWLVTRHLQGRSIPGVFEWGLPRNDAPPPGDLSRLALVQFSWGDPLQGNLSRACWRRSHIHG